MEGTDKIKEMHKASERYAYKWWGKNSVSRTVAAMAFCSGALWLARMIKKDIEIADLTGKMFPAQGIRNIVNKLLQKTK